ncbi:MAG TPA: hypothetical protein VHM20_05480 [Gammaproteobacteria bacterium]|jgi:hypothetical protein|nr:hypothetical protein [Gammaproteobacteria bacterium]
MLKQDIHLKFSNGYVIFILLCCAGSFLSIGYLNISLSAKIALFFLSITYGFYCLKTMRPFQTLKYLGENRWLLSTQKDFYIGQVCGDSTVTSQICILRFALIGHRFKKTCFIFRDSLEPGLYRCLLVELYAARCLA